MTVECSTKRKREREREIENTLSISRHGNVIDRKTHRCFQCAFTMFNVKSSEQEMEYILWRAIDLTSQDLSPSKNSTIFFRSCEEFLRRNCQEHEKSFSDTLYGGCLLFIAGRKWFILCFFFSFIGQRCNAKMFVADETRLQRCGDHKFHGRTVVTLSQHHSHTRVRKSQCESSK